MSRSVLFFDSSGGGDCAARKFPRTLAALALPAGREVKYAAALALAFSENANADRVRAEKVADDLARRFPEDTMVQFNYLPTVRAQIAVGRRDPAKAIDELQAAAPYELGLPNTFPLLLALYPVYVRGEAYLAAHQGSEAAAEFQKLLDQREVVLNEPIGALAHLQLGRAVALRGDTNKAKAAYQDFFVLWKAADPDLHILKEAKREYAILQ